MDVLVTGADQRQGLAVIRALGSEGIAVYALGRKANSLGFFSRYAKGHTASPSSSREPEQFVRLVAEIVNRHKIPVVLPSVESDVIALNEFRELFKSLAPNTALGIASPEALRVALDKAATYELATKLNIPVLETVQPKNVEHGIAFANTVGYPIVIKPRGQKFIRDTPLKNRFKVLYASNADALRQILETCAAEVELPLLQRFAAGAGVALGIYALQGDLLGVYQYERTREYPLTGGVSSVHKSMPVNTKLHEYVEQLVRELAWDGIAQFEFKHDAAGSPFLIEINGRCWAPVSGANKLGLNFPYPYYCYLRDKKRISLPLNYPTGQRCRYLRGDCDALESYLADSICKEIKPLPSTSHLLWELTKDFSPRVSGDVYDWRDPLPALREGFSLARDYGPRLTKLLLTRGKRAQH